MKPQPIISFIIPCYNMGCYLGDAIRSCLAVPVDSKEIIVVDDGSTDHSASVARSFDSIIYHVQQNQGLAAARNMGAALAIGEYICFLDADDWLIAQNIPISIHMLNNDPEAAFVFGRHLIQQEDGQTLRHQPSISSSVYADLLRSNIIGNPSTVIYRKSIAQTFLFSGNPAFKGCEDYHQYLRIAQQHKILFHEHPVSVYRRHPGNMSNNWAMMLDAALNVLYDHQKWLNSPAERMAWQNGVQAWMQYYSYFPLRSGGKWQFNRYHINLAKKIGWKLPLILFQKCLKRS